MDDKKWQLLAGVTGFGLLIWLIVWLVRKG